jgi:hypothetical protein
MAKAKAWPDWQRLILHLPPASFAFLALFRESVPGGQFADGVGQGVDVFAGEASSERSEPSM